MAAGRIYSITELERLVVVLWIIHFHSYLYGHQVTTYTNHSALQAVLNTPTPSGKHAQWWSKVSFTSSCNNYNLHFFHQILFNFLFSFSSVTLTSPSSSFYYHHIKSLLLSISLVWCNLSRISSNSWFQVSTVLSTANSHSLACSALFKSPEGSSHPVSTG